MPKDNTSQEKTLPARTLILVTLSITYKKSRIFAINRVRPSEIGLFKNEPAIKYAEAAALKRKKMSW
jgi:hypothetical protein